MTLAGTPLERAVLDRNGLEISVPSVAGVDSYKSTACRRNSSEQFFLAIVLDHLASPADAGISVSKNQGQAPVPAPWRLTTSGRANES